MGKREGFKKAQVVLFIIIGVLMFFSILALFFLIQKPGFKEPKKPFVEPYLEVKSCISKSLEKVLSEFLEKGMYFNPSNYLVYKEKNVAYHCFTSEKRTICTRNDAQSKKRIEKELEEKMIGEIEKCFEDFKEKKKTFNIVLGETDFSIELQPKEVYLKIRKPIEIFKEGEEKMFFDNFGFRKETPLWDYILISNEIINDEVKCNCPRESCTADISTLMDRYNNYKITFFIGSGGEKVYTIEDYTDKKNTFNFAIKNCDKTP